MLLLKNSCESSSSSEGDETVGFQTQQHRRKIYRDRINFDFFLESVFIERFRLSRSAAEKVLIAIGQQIDHKTNKNHALNPKQQILTALHFFGNGSQYHSIGDMHGIHKSTVCRIVDRVSRAIIRILFLKYVRWPNNCAHISGGFFSIAGFPRLAGAVDGTLIPIKAPRMNENDYVDRHGQHSINAMVVCGPNYEFFYASVRWPGTVHDNRVLRNSTLYDKWELQSKYYWFNYSSEFIFKLVITNLFSLTDWRPFENAILLGDSGYQNLNWLLTPNIPTDLPLEGSRRYLRRHRSTRQMAGF